MDVEGDIRIADGTEGSGKYLVSTGAGIGFWAYEVPPPCKPGGVSGYGYEYGNSCYGVNSFTNFYSSYYTIVSTAL